MKKTRTPVSLLLCTLLAMLMLLMLLPLGTVSFAAGETPEDTVVTVVETGDCGAEGSDVQYTLYSDGTMIIEGTGAVKQNAFYRNEAIKSLIMQEGITSIALSAFSECLKLETVVLPDSLTRIGDWAFYCCRTLQSLEGGNHMKSLGRGALAATGLKRYKIPDSVETIDECLYLFDDSTAIEEVIFGRGIRELSDSGIQDYRHGTLTKVVFLNKDTVIPNGPFNRIFSTGAVPTIYGFAGGAVEAYANQYDHPFVDLATVEETDHDWDEGTVTKLPTCTEPGEMTYLCKTNPSHRKTETIPATGKHVYKETIKPTAYCKDGSRTLTCIYCGDVKIETLPAPFDHTYNDGVITAPATCGEDGVKNFTCIYCGATYTETVPATGHNWSEWIVTRNPSETREGEAYRYCKNDRTHIETKTIDKLPETHEQSSNPIQRILDWVKSFFDSIGDLFRNLFRF